MGFEGDGGGTPGREPAGVGLEDPDLGLEPRQVGDLRERLACSRRPAPPAAARRASSASGRRCRREAPSARGPPARARPCRSSAAPCFPSRATRSRLVRARPSRSLREPTACRSFCVARPTSMSASMISWREKSSGSRLWNVSAVVRSRRACSASRPRFATIAPDSARSFSPRWSAVARPRGRRRGASTVRVGSRRTTTSPAFTGLPSSIIQPIFRLTSFPGTRTGVASTALRTPSARTVRRERSPSSRRASGRRRPRPGAQEAAPRASAARSRRGEDAERASASRGRPLRRGPCDAKDGVSLGEARRGSRPTRRCAVRRSPGPGGLRARGGPRRTAPPRSGRRSRTGP